MTNIEETDPIESQIVRASALESHGWSSEPNRSQCKLRVQEIKSLVFLLTYFFLFVLATPFFILRDNILADEIARECPFCHGHAAEKNYDGVCLRTRDHRIHRRTASFGK